MSINIKIETDKSEYEVEDRIDVKITLVNNYDVEKEIFFNNGQRYDFILKKGTEEVWHWSESKVFTMAAATISLAPGKERSYTEKLELEHLDPGEYELIGIITGKPEFRDSCFINLLDR